MNNETDPKTPEDANATRVSPLVASSSGATATPDSETLAQPSEPTTSASLRLQNKRNDVPGYELLAELGRGGMGVVYKAKQIKLNRVVALKMILAGGHADPREIARFIAEAQAVAAIRHPNVIQIFDSGEADGHPYMAMECLEGGSLASHLKSGLRFSPRTAAELMIQIARGVQAAHERGIIHRDLKPHNVLLELPSPNSPPGTLGAPKVMDFGLAKREGAELTQTGAVMGTPAYMSPEQARGETKTIGPRSDVYALGVILYECLCGSVPFQGRDPWSVIKQVIEQEPEAVTKRIQGVPRELDLICRKCLAKDSHERYESAAAFADDLQRYLNGEPIRGPQTGFWYTTRKTASRWWRPVATLVVLLGIVIGAWLLPSPVAKKDPPTQPAQVEKEDPVVTLLRKEVSNKVATILAREPAPDRVSPHPVTILPKLNETDYSAFNVISDERTVDMRGWKPLPPGDPNAECSFVYFTRREMLKVKPTNHLLLETLTSGRDVVNRVARPNADKVTAFKTDEPGFVGQQGMKRRQMQIDISDIPVNQEFTLRYSSTYWNSLQTLEEQWFGVIGYEGSVKTSMLMIFPPQKPFREYRFYSAPVRSGKTDKREEPTPYTGPLITFAAEDRSWIYWEIPNPKAKTVYRIDWTW